MPGERWGSTCQQDCSEVIVVCVSLDVMTCHVTCHGHCCCWRSSWRQASWRHSAVTSSLTSPSTSPSRRHCVSVGRTLLCLSISLSVCLSMCVCVCVCVASALCVVSFPALDLVQYLTYYDPVYGRRPLCNAAIRPSVCPSHGPAHLNNDDFRALVTIEH